MVAEAFKKLTQWGSASHAALSARQFLNIISEPKALDGCSIEATVIETYATLVIKGNRFKVHISFRDWGVVTIILKTKMPKWKTFDKIVLNDMNDGGYQVLKTVEHVLKFLFIVDCLNTCFPDHEEGSEFLGITFNYPLDAMNFMLMFYSNVINMSFTELPTMSQIKPSPGKPIPNYVRAMLMFSKTLYELQLGFHFDNLSKVRIEDVNDSTLLDYHVSQAKTLLPTNNDPFVVLGAKLASTYMKSVGVFMPIEKEFKLNLDLLNYSYKSLALKESNNGN